MPPRGRAKGRSSRAKSKRVVLVFGESPNDREALKHLVRALAPSVGSIEPIREPLVLQKGRPPERQKAAADRLAKVVRARQAVHEVEAVVAHEDCDALEPEHQKLEKEIETRLESAGVSPVVAACPAWEMETWWYLWPTALRHTNPSWARVDRKGKDLGKIANSKEALRRDLLKGTPPGTVRYEETDAPRIARHVERLNIVDQRNARSASFDSFASRLRAVLCR